MLMFFTPFTRNGDWNDADGQPDACERGQAANKDLDCRFGQHGLFPLCQVTGPPASAPGAPRVWGTGATSSFRVQVCVDRIDTLFFQDDRLWLSYGGQWSAPGASPDCPDRYKGKAYVNSQEWDISGMAGCQQGVQCKSPRYRCHLGCILLKMAAMSLRRPRVLDVHGRPVHGASGVCVHPNDGYEERRPRRGHLVPAVAPVLVQR